MTLCKGNIRLVIVVILWHKDAAEVEVITLLKRTIVVECTVKHLNANLVAEWVEPATPVAHLCLIHVDCQILIEELISRCTTLYKLDRASVACRERQVIKEHKLALNSDGVCSTCALHGDSTEDGRSNKLTINYDIYVRRCWVVGKWRVVVIWLVDTIRKHWVERIAILYVVEVDKHLNIAIPAKLCSITECKLVVTREG